MSDADMAMIPQPTQCLVRHVDGYEWKMAHFKWAREVWFMGYDLWIALVEENGVEQWVVNGPKFRGVVKLDPSITTMQQAARAALALYIQLMAMHS